MSRFNVKLLMHTRSNCPCKTNALAILISSLCNICISVVQIFLRVLSTIFLLSCCEIYDNWNNEVAHNICHLVHFLFVIYTYRKNCIVHIANIIKQTLKLLYNCVSIIVSDCSYKNWSITIKYSSRIFGWWIFITTQSLTTMLTHL